MTNEEEEEEGKGGYFWEANEGCEFEKTSLGIVKANLGGVTIGLIAIAKSNGYVAHLSIYLRARIFVFANAQYFPCRARQMAHMFADGYTASCEERSEKE